jgi:hypothetical protein
MMLVLFNEDSEDDLIPQSHSNKSSDNERPESPAIALISDTADKATPEHRHATVVLYCIVFISNSNMYMGTGKGTSHKPQDIDSVITFQCNMFQL